MIEQKLQGKLTLPILKDFLKSTGAALAYVQIHPHNVEYFKEHGFVIESNVGPRGEGLEINGKPLFADEKVSGGTLRALDGDKNVIGILKVAHDDEVSDVLATSKSSGDGQDAGDWTQAGRDETGFPVPKGSAEDVTPSEKAGAEIEQAAKDLAQEVAGEGTQESK